MAILIVSILLLSFVPHSVSANGSQTYSTPGSYSFVVPAYGTLTVTVRGAGGGGGGQAQLTNLTAFPGNPGSAGGNSSFSGVIGYGGAGGTGGNGTINQTSCSSYPGSAGAPGGAAGGSSNTTGAGAAGGSGGSYWVCFFQGAVSVVGPGGPGGAGGQATRSYTFGQLNPGASVTVVVGTGGAGGYSNNNGYTGGTGASGSNGSVAVSWTTATPSCTINAAPTTINQPSGTALTWVSANATTFYISSVGYVTANVSNGATVYPTATITYTGTATGPGGTATCSRTVTVNRSCTFNGNTILHGASATAYQSSSVPFGNSCVSQVRTCTNGTLSGTYTYASCSVSPAANCTFNGNTVLHGASVTAYQASSVPFGSSCSSQSRSCTNGTLSGTYTHASCSVTPAANCTLNGVTVLHGASRTFYTQQTAPVGQICSAISQSRTCTNGTLSGSSSYQYGSCLCAPIYSCSGSNIRYTNSSCSTSTVATCSAPGYCTAGQSTCQYDAMSFTPFSATSTTGSTFTATGHLQARPGLVRSGDRANLYWNVADALSCSVMGTNGDSWTQISSPSWGYTTSPLYEMTRFTLSCVAYPSVTPATLQETDTVLLAPDFSER